jgi:hypothetical protein
MSLPEKIYFGGILLAYGALALALAYAQYTAWAPARQVKRDR